MGPNLVKLLFALMSVLLGLASVLRPAAAADSLNLGEAFRLALDGHPLVELKRGGIEAAQEDVEGAKWKRFPSVTVENGRFLGQQSVIQTNSRPNTSTWRVQQPLWTGGKIDTEIDGMGLRKQVAESSLLEVEQDLLMRVAQSYSDLVRLQERIQIAVENLAEHQRLFDQIRRRTDQQVSAEVDVALAQARLRQTQTELITMRAAASSARSTLEQLVGKPVASVERVSAPVAPLRDIAEVLTAARAHAPMLKRLERERDVAKNDVETRRAQIYPNVSLRYEKFSGAATVVPFDRMMVVLEYQTGAGLSSMSAIEAAFKRAGMASSAIDSGMREVTEKTLNQYSEARAFVDQVESSKAYAIAASAVMASYQRQYTTGRKSWLDVMNAQREKNLALYSDVDVAAGVLLSSLKLDILIGRLNRASLSEYAQARREVKVLQQ